jgi:hypothetical protein
MISPNILSIFTVVFVLLGVYNLYTGFKRLREAFDRGQKLAWYKQINMLTGYEYLLLSIVFIISLNYRAIPKAMQSIVVPLYFVVLVSSALLAGFVIKQAISNSRRPKVASQRTVGSANSTIESGNDLTPEERAARMQHKRERRQKAANARRRRAGKA